MSHTPGHQIDNGMGDVALAVARGNNHVNTARSFATQRFLGFPIGESGVEIEITGTE